MATLLGRGTPYKNVISLGHILDKHGQKMSKSKGNVVDPWEMMNKYGIDAVRWYMYTATPPGEPKNFDEQEIAKTLRRFHLILYNSFMFYRTYADTRRLGRGLMPKNQHKSVSNQHLSVLDKWILARLNALGAVGSAFGLLPVFWLNALMLGTGSVMSRKPPGRES